MSEPMSDAVIELDGATVRGSAAAVDGVHVYLGLRFAEPPVGPYRFMAPVPHELHGEIDAGSFGPAAPQLPGMGIVPGDVTPRVMDEDCLFLNVWTPTTPGPHPVFVWFYGGSFLSGATSDPTIDGARLANRGDMVVVTVGYRVGALGFLSIGDTNCGLRDQQCALRWAQKHIDAFGGDARNVTIAGESAGGGSVLHLLAAPSSAGLFQRAIVQSGATDYTRTRTEIDRVTEMYCEALSGDDPRAVPWQRIIEAQGEALMPLMMEMARMPFHPCVDDDVLGARPVDALKAGVGADVDLMIGTTRDEMRLFLMEPTIADSQMRKRVDRYVGHDGSEVVRAYQAIVGTDPMDVWAAIMSDREMLLPAVAVADAHRGETYRYLFTWGVSPRADGVPLRACHAADLPFTFGTLDQLGWDRWTGADAEPALAAALVETMQRDWFRFARTGKRSTGTGALVQYGPQYEDDDQLKARLAVWR